MAKIIIEKKTEDPVRVAWTTGVPPTFNGIRITLK